MNPIINISQNSSKKSTDDGNVYEQFNQLDAIKEQYQDNPEVIKAIELLQSGENVFLTGEAGTGKSQLLQQIRQTLKNVLVLAPTGISALKVDGQTLHSFFGLELRPYLPEDTGIERLKDEKARIMRNCELIIIDEISMVRSDVLSAVDKKLRLTMSNKKPFGGKQIMFVGDLYQLPPIVTSQEKEIIESNYASKFFFDAHNLSDVFEHIVLTKVYRQTLSL